MNIRIYPSKIQGEIAAPPSKSVTHRAIILAALADGISHIKNILVSDDTFYTIQALEKLGVKIERNGSSLVVHGTGGKLIAPTEEISVGNSGSTMRMIAGVAALAKGKTVLTGEKRLKERPMKDLLIAFQNLGMHLESVSQNDYPPIIIHGGEIAGGKVTIPGNISSQYITSLLLIAPFTKETLIIEVEGEFASKPYVALTIDLMKQFGVDVTNKDFKEFTVLKGQNYGAQDYTVEGDFSSASYLFAASAVTKGTIIVSNLNPNSSQGDKYFLEILKLMGCDVSIHHNKIEVKGPSKLSGIEIDMKNTPDIVQTTAIVAAYAQGITKLKNISHLQFKETNRLTAPASELQKMNIRSEVTDDSMIIHGGKPSGAEIQTYNDHRMAMSFAIAGLAANGVTTIKQAEVVNKSYPNFFEDLKKIGAKIEAE